MRGKISEETIRALADATGLQLESDRAATLVRILASVVVGVAAFDELDLESVEPEIVFQARWD